MGSPSGGASSILSLAGLGFAPFTGGASLAATGLAAGGAGLGAVSSLLQAQGTSSADIYKAEQLERAAQYGDLKATQTGAEMTRNLNIKLGNIDAIRAASRDDPTSPTGAAVRDYTQEVGTEQKNITVDSILAQSQEDESNAAYLRSLSSTALLSGDLSAIGGLLGKGGLAGLPILQGGGGASPNPTTTGA
jgi:Apolipoprotein L